MDRRKIGFNAGNTVGSTATNENAGANTDKSKNGSRNGNDGKNGRAGEASEYAFRRLLLEACLALLAIVFTAVIFHLCTPEREVIAGTLGRSEGSGISGGVTLSEAVFSACSVFAPDGQR